MVRRIVTALIIASATTMWSAVPFGAAGDAASIVDAAKRGDRQAVRALVTGRVDVNAREADGTSALHWAVRANDTETAGLLIAAGANVNAANRYGITPLWLAAKNGNAATLDALLKAGAEPDYALPSGETALLVTAHTGNVAAVRMLLAHGANVHVRERVYGQNALMAATAENHADVVTLLLEAGADVKVRTEALKVNARGGLTNYAKGEFTALMYAARQGAVAAGKALVAAGADVNEGDPDGIGPLRLSIFNGHFDFAGMLVAAGADVNAADAIGRTPLYEAVALHRLELMAGRPAPKWTDTLSSLDIVTMLLEKGADPNIGLIKPEPLRKAGTFADSLLGEGTTPFLKAAKNNDIPVMKLLLQYGADPHVQSPTVKASALALAAGVGWRELSSNAPEKDGLEAVQMLWDLGGFDINAHVEGGFAPGQTALHGAASRGATTIVQFLVDKGAQLDAVDKRGRTPFDAASAVEEGMTDGTHQARPAAQALLTKLGGLPGKNVIKEFPITQ